MTVDETLLIAGPPWLGDPETLLRWAQGRGAHHPDEVASYTRRVWALAPAVGIKPQFVFAQALQECSSPDGQIPFANSWWDSALNAASLGITGDPAQDAQAPTFATGADAATAHVAHVYCYAVGDPDTVPQLKGKDPRRQAFLDAGYQFGAFPTIRDFTNTYAKDPQYAAGIVAHLNALPALNVPFALATGGPVSTPTPTPTQTPTPPPAALPAPTIIDKTMSNGKWFANRYDAEAGVQGYPRVVVLHIQRGTSQGSYDEFANDPSRQASSTVLVNRDGSVWTCVPEQHGPWTNGDVRSPTPHGQTVVGWGGNPNIWTLSVENEGYSRDLTEDASNAQGWPPGLTDAQVATNAWLVRHWLAEYPRIELVLPHSSFNDDQSAGADVGRWYCPGNADYLAVLAALGMTAPEVSSMAGKPAPVVATPPPASFAQVSPVGPISQLTVINGHEYLPYTVPQVTIRDNVPVRRFASPSSVLVAPGYLPKGHDVRPKAICVGSDGNLYFCDVWDNRLACADCAPKGA